MRRLTVVLLASAILSGWAGNASANHMSLGIEGGLSMANITTDPTTTTDSRTGLSLGATFDLQLYEWLYLNPEVLYVQAGAKNQATPVVTSKVDYIAVPVNFKAKFDATPEFKPYVFVGPSIAFKVTGKTDDGTTTADILGLKSTDFGLGFGGGFQWWVTPTVAVNLNGRYVLGLSNDLDTTTTASSKNKAFIAMAGVDFGF